MAKTILLTDDDVGFRSAVKLALELEGYTVIEAEDGGKALQKLREMKVDLLITDILMPEVEGNELAAQVTDQWPELKIIGITGGGNLGDADRVRSLCVTPLFEVILKKPCKTEDMLAEVAKALASC